MSSSGHGDEVYNDSLVEYCDNCDDGEEIADDKFLDLVPTLFQSQLDSLNAISNADSISFQQKRLSTVAIVTPTSSGKELLPFVWAKTKRKVAIHFVPYTHLAIGARECAAKFNFTVEMFSDAKLTNNSAANVVVCAYEQADQVLLLCIPCTTNRS